MEALPFIEHIDLSMDEGTFMWVDVLRLKCDRDDATSIVLGRLLQTPVYQQTYSSPFALGGTSSGFHDRWAIAEMDSDWFVQSTEEEAVRAINEWANLQDWTDGTRGMSAVSNAALNAQVYPLLRTPEVFRFTPPEESKSVIDFDPHFIGFHEWIAIDRPAEEVRVVVATDD